MFNQNASHTSALLIVAILLAALLLVLGWVLPLSAGEFNGVLILVSIGCLYAFIAVRYIYRYLGARSLYVTTPINVILVTLGYSLLYRNLPSAWILYFILPLGAVLSYRPLAAVITGFVSALVYLSFETLVGDINAHPIETALSAIVLIIFSLVTGIFVNSAHRQEQELTLLSKLSQALNTAMRVDELLEIIHDELAKILPVDAYFVALYDAGKDELDFALGLDRDVRERHYRASAKEGLAGQVVQTRQPLLIQDYSRVRDQFPANPTWGTEESSRSLMLVPILRQTPQTPNAVTAAEILGVLSIQSYKPRAYTLHDLQLLESLTRTLSYALERAHLYEQIQSARVVEQATLLRLSQELLGLFEPQAVLNRALAITHHSFESAATQIWLLDEYGENWKLADALEGERSNAQPTSMAFKTFAAGVWTSQHHRALVVSDSVTETTFQLPEPLRASGARSGIVAPLQAGERFVGTLIVAHAQPHTWNEDEIRILSLIANQTALAYERTRLWQSLQARVQTLQILAEASRSFASITDLKETTRIIIESAARLLGAERSFISLFDPNKGTLLAREPALGVTASELARFNAEVAPELIRYFRPGEIFLANDPSQFTPVLRAFNESSGVRNQLDAWMILQNQPIGILCLANKTQAAGFTTEDAHLITTLANQAAVAIQNARLYESLRESESHYRILAEDSLLGVYLIQDNRFLYVNPALANILGYRVEDIVAHFSPLDIVHPTDRALVADNIRRRDNGEISSTQSEFRILRADQSIREVESHGARILLGGRPATLGTMLDITDRKHAAERLEQKVEALETLAEIDRQIMAAGDRAAVLDLVCRRAAELLRVPKSLIDLSLSSHKHTLAASYGLLDPDLAASEITRATFSDSAPDASSAAHVFFLNDIPADDSHLPEFRVRENIRAYARASLHADGELLGSLDVFDTSPHEWSDDEIQLLDLLAGQAAIALARTRLLEKTRNHLRETLLLNHVIAATSSTQEPLTILQIVCDEMARAFNLPHVAIIMRDGEQTASVIAEAREPSRRSLLGARYQIQGNPLISNLRTRRVPIVLSSANANSEYSSALQALQQIGFNAAVLLPLLVVDRTPGTIALFSIEAREFTTDELNLAQNVASAASHALEHAELLAHAHNRLERLSTLHDIMLAINSASSLQERLNVLLEMTRAQLHADIGTVFLREPGSPLLRIFASSGAEPQFAVGYRLSIGQGAAGWIAYHDQPLAIADIKTDPRWQEDELTRRAGLMSYVGTPLRVQGDVIGVLDFASRTRRVFTDEETEFLSTLAGQAAVAIQNARLFESEEAERLKLQLLYQVERELTTSLNAQMILRRAVGLVTRALGGFMGEGFIYDSTLSSLRLVALARPDVTEPPTLIVPLSPNLGEGLVGWVANRRESILANDLQADPRWVPLDDLDASARSAISVPLAANDQLLGVLSILSEQQNAFTPDQLDLLSALGHPISIALSNAQSYAQAEERVSTLAALNETSREITAQPDLPMLLETIVERAKQLFDAPGAALSIFDAARRELIPAVTRGYKIPDGAIVRLGEGVVGRAAETRQPLIVPDYQQSEYRLSSFREVPIRSLVAVPMLYRGELIGTLAVLELGDAKRQFTETDARLLSLFAAQAAGAIHNARLIEELRARANQFGLLYDAGLALNSVLEPKAQLEYLVQIARRALHAGRAEFHRYDEDRNELLLEVGVGHSHATAARIRELRFALGDMQGIVGWVGAESVPLNVPDVSRDPRWLNIDSEIKSGLWVPVEHENRLLGVLAVFATRPDAFSMQDERLLALFANQVAVALVNARLFTETQHRAEEAETLRQAAAVVAATLQPEDAIERILVQLERMVPYDSASVQLLHEGYMEIVGGRGWQEPTNVVGLRFSIPGDNPNTIVVQTRQPLILNDARDAYPVFAERVHSSIASWLGVPLIVHDNVIGMLAVDSVRSHYFTSEHLRLLSAFADQVAITLENARLFAETRRRLAEQEALNQIAAALRTKASLDEMLDYFLDQVLALLDTNAGNILLYDEISDIVDARSGRGWFTGILTSPAHIREGISGHVIASGEPYLVHEFVSDRLTRASARAFIPNGWGGACIPIRDLNHIVGTLMVGVPLPRELNASEISWLTTLAEILGFNIHRLQPDAPHLSHRRRSPRLNATKRKRALQ